MRVEEVVWVRMAFLGGERAGVGVEQVQWVGGGGFGFGRGVAELYRRGRGGDGREEGETDKGQVGERGEHAGNYGVTQSRRWEESSRILYAGIDSCQLESSRSKHSASHRLHPQPRACPMHIYISTRSEQSEHLVRTG